jgi:hypothetical protein
MRVEIKLLNRINLICPVKPLLQKYSDFPKTQISCISIPVPSHLRGARAIVTDAGRDAVDAAASGTTRDGRAGREARELSTAS